MNDDELRTEALRQAVAARNETDEPGDITKRAQAFYTFLSARPENR